MALDLSIVIRFVLLFAYKFKHTKNAYALLLLFVLIRAVLSEEE